MFKKRRQRKLKAELEREIARAQTKIRTLQTEIKRAAREAAGQSQYLKDQAAVEISTKQKLLKGELKMFGAFLRQNALLELNKLPDSAKLVQKLDKRLDKALEAGDPGAMADALMATMDEIDDMTSRHDEALGAVQIGSDAETVDADMADARSMIQAEEELQQSDRQAAILSKMKQSSTDEVEEEPLSEVDETEANEPTKFRAKQRE